MARVDRLRGRAVAGGAVATVVVAGILFVLNAASATSTPTAGSSASTTSTVPSTGVPTTDAAATSPPSTTPTTFTATTTGLFPTSSPVATPAGCTAERNGSTVAIEWLDDGGVHVLRRNGEWLATPGAGVTRHIDDAAPAGATYELRTWTDSGVSALACVETAGVPPATSAPPPLAAIAARVIHISVDGLRSDYVTPELMPNLSRLIAQGASTLNARTDPAFTQTLPNHTSQFTGRPVFGADGHHIDFNVDLGTTVQQEAGTYVASVFDVVHDHGGGTMLSTGKTKFDIFDRSWNEVNGAPDLTGADDGRDKIDTYVVTTPDEAVGQLVDRLSDPRVEYAFFHIRYPDETGHESTWASAEYGAAATHADAVLGQIAGAIETDSALATSTAIIVVADHGGPTGGLFHSDATLAENYTIPFVVWGPGVQAGADLYALNAGRRTDPGTAQPPLEGPQPIRGHDVANLALEFLGYGPVPGSTFNARQDLAVG